MSTCEPAIENRICPRALARPTPAPAADTRAATPPSRWAVLALVGIAQIMVVLDATVINIALPSAQRALGVSTDSRQWAITAYALAFGSLLLLGGKLGDIFGRKRTFIAGLIGFSAASALGGFAQSFAVLLAARALQGSFAALLAPSALGLLTVTFADSPDRPRAFAIFSALAASGASIGLLLGGAITQLISWRWCLYINLVIAIPTALVAVRLLVNQRPSRRPRIDLPGVVAGSLAVFALVFGFSDAETHSWSAPLTIAALAVSVLALAGFVAIERRSDHPLLPLHIVADRRRGGAYASIAIVFGTTFSVFLFLTFYLQRTLGFSPLTTGLAFLPMTATTIIAAGITQTRIVPRTGPKPPIIFGMLAGIAAMLLFTRLTPDGTYAGQVLPGLIVTGVAVGSVFAACIGTATLGVDPHEVGVASAMLNTSQQVGGSVGTALLSTLFASSASSYAASRVPSTALATAAAVHGYTTAFAWAAGLFGVGVLIALAVLPPRGNRRPGAVNTPSPAAAD